jgi:hypothetical protein
MGDYCGELRGTSTSLLDSRQTIVFAKKQSIRISFPIAVQKMSPYTYMIWLA